jgi:hypothetical protein
MSLLPPLEAIYPDPETAFVAIQLHSKAVAQKKVLWRRYFGCAGSFILKRKGDHDLAKYGHDLGGP